jgi:hypothetical protein
MRSDYHHNISRAEAGERNSGASEQWDPAPWKPLKYSINLTETLREQAIFTPGYSLGRRLDALLLEIVGPIVGGIGAQ